MKEYKTYAFDMDLTLLDTIETSVESYKASIELMGCQFNPDDVVYMLSTPLRTTYAELKNPKKPYEDFLNEFVRVSQSTFLSGSHFYPDAIETVRYLYGKGKKLAVVTNRDTKVIIDVLNKEGILSYFSSIITCDRVVNLKPDPEPILACLKETDTAKEDFLYVGDAKNDWMSACNAGVDFVAVERYDNCKFDAEVKVHSLTELKKDI